MDHLALILVSAVIFVNGWTDAPNAITCVVSTGSLPYRRAVRLAAVCNLLGLLGMSFISAAVAETIGSLVYLEQLSPELATAMLCAAMCAIVLFAVSAWYFGIPTSESHALIAALTGAAFAVGGSALINLQAWRKVIWGLALSLVLGFGLGWVITKLPGRFLSRAKSRSLDRLQIASAAGMAFMHGAQDGQKFIAVFLLVRTLAGGTMVTGLPPLSEQLPTVFFCAGVMALGTLVGGKRIIATVGGRMVQLEKYQGACADLGAALCLLLASLWGAPMSTTHTKTAAILGAGTAVKGGKADTGTVKSMLGAWLFTFPVCGMIGYLVAAVLLHWV